MKRPALLIPAYGLAALGTAAAYLHFSFGIVAGFDGIAKGRYFLGPLLSILSALAVVALWRVWLIGARLWRYGAYINALPRDGRYDAAGVVSAVIALVGFGAIAQPIYRTVEVIVFGILLTPAVVLATVALVRGRSHSQTNASDTAVDESAAATFNAPLRLADLPGLVCGTSIALLGIVYLVPRPISGWGPCNWTVFYPLYQDLWPVERTLVFDACDDGAGIVWVIGVSLSLVCLVSGNLAAYIGKNANAVRGAASAAIAVAVVLTALSIERLGSRIRYTSAGCDRSSSASSSSSALDGWGTSVESEPCCSEGQHEQPLLRDANVQSDSCASSPTRPSLAPYSRSHVSSWYRCPLGNRMTSSR